MTAKQRLGEGLIALVITFSVPIVFGYAWQDFSAFGLE